MGQFFCQVSLSIVHSDNTLFLGDVTPYVVFIYLGKKSKCWIYYNKKVYVWTFIISGPPVQLVFSCEGPKGLLSKMISWCQIMNSYWGDQKHHNSHGADWCSWPDEKRQGKGLEAKKDMNWVSWVQFNTNDFGFITGLLDKHLVCQVIILASNTK
jgi:hypothetical protein